MNLNHWSDEVWEQGSWLESAWDGGGGPAPAPEPDQPAGGYFDYGTRRRSKEELERARARFGIQAAEVISEVASRQAESLGQDAQQRFEELERELALREIAWRAEYLEALNEARERLITQEIASLLAAQQEEQAVLMLVALIA